MMLFLILVAAILVALNFDVIVRVIGVFVLLLFLAALIG